MIRWCCYCQTLLGEVAPLTDYTITHGICARCDERLEADEPLIAQNAAVINFYRALFDAGRDGELSTCVEMAGRAIKEGYAPVDLLVGLLQPALETVGRHWELGLATVAQEHAFTAWCEGMMAAVPRLIAPPGPLELLIVQAPGNRHVIGAHIAEQSLLDHGVIAQSVPGSPSVESVEELIRQRAPRWLGFSCALPHMIDGALEMADKLVARGYRGGVMLSGQAVRRTPAITSPIGVELCLTVGDAGRLIQRSRAANTT